jgi:Gpi18-like mannosyltransferase
MATTLPVAAALGKPIAEPTRTRRFKPAGIAFALALGLRIFYTVFTALLSPHLRLDPKLIYSNSLTSHLISRDSHPLLYALLGVWQRFDTLWYIQISAHGYDSPMATVFYPLYPALVRALSFITRSDLTAALLVSTAGSFFLFWGALRLFELDYTPSVAFRGLLLWVVWPASFAFFAGYPDSLLCAFTVWAIYFARSGRWLPAGALGLFAGLTKALGCLTALPLLWIAWKHRDRRGIIPAGLCVAGAACFQGWLSIRHFPSPTQIYRTYWATTTVAPWITVSDAARSLAHGGNFLLLLNAGVFVMVGVAAVMRPVRPEYRIYAVAAMCLFLTKHTEPLLQSTTRYSLALFAAYPALSTRFGRGLTFASLLLIAAALNLLLFRTFLDWGLVV